ncbi:MAG: LysR family glycine cleavage system transcriptional activator [Verrucomicrobiales bacterium]|jgi:LysR family glycine cleavage system transcriptional activator
MAVFDAVARLGSFTAAARELGVSQPSISRHIITLEDQLGFPLFDRRANQIELTGHGSRLYNAISSSFDSLESTLIDLQRTTERLLVASTPMFAQTWLSPLFDSLRDRLDPCVASILIFDSDAEIDDLTFDVVIRRGEGTWPGFRAEKLLPEVVVPVASPDLAKRLGFGDDTDPEELLDAPRLHLSETNTFQTTWTNWFAGQGISSPKAESSHTFRHYGTLLNEALAGNGLVLGWRYQMGDWLERGLLVEVGLEMHDPNAGMFLTWPVAITRDSRVRALRTWFADNLPPDRLTAHG